MEAIKFICSICGESSTDICVYCTKDACSNHLCERCHRCSDCCPCEMRLTEDEVTAPAHNGHGHISVTDEIPPAGDHGLEADDAATEPPG